MTRKFALLSLISGFLCAGAPAEEPVTHQQIVQDGITAFRAGMTSENEADRLATFDEFMPKKEHVALLFGAENAEIVWPKMEKQLNAMREHSAEVKAELDRKGEVVEIELLDVRSDDTSGRYGDVLKVIPEHVGVFRAITKSKSGSSGSSSYLVIGGKMVILRGLESIHEYLETLEKNE